MNDLEISKALALAIGWNSEHLKVTDDVFVWWDGYWRVFSYADWNVIGPIAERHDCFPHRYNRKGSVYDGFWVTHQTHHFTDTPQKAIAMAVIGAKK